MARSPRTELVRGDHTALWEVELPGTIEVGYYVQEFGQFSLFSKSFDSLDPSRDVLSGGRGGRGERVTNVSCNTGCNWGVTTPANHSRKIR
jgi:hypothetical protein